MEKEIFNKQKQEIITLEEEVKKLKEAKQKVKIIRAKEKELFDLKVKHYNDFYNGDIPDYSIISEKAPYPYKNDYPQHYLSDYSGLNVDEVGKLICELFKKYENKNMHSRRIIVEETYEPSFVSSRNITEEKAYLIIGSRYKIYNPYDEYGDLDEDKLIIIEYDDFMDLNKFPTNKPIKTLDDVHIGAYYCYCEPEEFVSSNYNYLLNSRGEIIFDDKNKAFIEDLIYSLAYHQYKNGITYMSEEETKDTFKRIYKIK